MAWGRAWVLGSIVAISACKAPEVHEPMVARVNGEGISKEQFDDLVGRNLRRYSSQTHDLPQGIRARIEEGVLRRMIDDFMVQQRAQKEGVTVTDKELDAHFLEHKQRFRSPQAFNDYLARSDTTEAALRDDLRKSLLRDRLVERLTGAIAISDADVAAYYKDNLGHFSEPTQMHVRRLLLRMPQDASPAAQRRIEALARKLHDTAKRHPEGFAALCKKHSQGPEADHEGNMGTVTSGRMPELDKMMVDGLAKDAVSPVVQTAQGLEIYQINHVVMAHQRPLSEAQDGIREALMMRRRNDRRQEVLRQLKEGAKVETLITFTTPAPKGAAQALPTTTPKAP